MKGISELRPVIFLRFFGWVASENGSVKEIIISIWNAKSENAEVDVKSILRTRTGGIFVELGLKIDENSTFCETVQCILGTKVLVSSLELMCTLEIRDLDCLTNTEEAEEVLKKVYADVGYLKLGVTSVNSRGDLMGQVVQEKKKS